MRTLDIEIDMTNRRWSVEGDRESFALLYFPSSARDLKRALDCRITGKAPGWERTEDFQTLFGHVPDAKSFPSADRFVDEAWMQLMRLRVKDAMRDAGRVQMNAAYGAWGTAKIP